MRQTVWAIAVLYLPALLSLSLAASEPPSPRGDTKKSEPASEEVLQRAIKQLGDDSFTVRRQAREQLLKVGKAAKRFLEEATKSKDPEVANGAQALLDELRSRELAAAEVHVVGLYESRGGKAVVEVRSRKTPVILVLCAYEAVTWEVRAAEGTEILQVIASGYHQQRVEGTTAPVTTSSYDERSRDLSGQSAYFYTYDHDEEKYPKMVERVRQLTGKKVTSFQGRYSFKKIPFVIGAEE